MTRSEPADMYLLDEPRSLFVPEGASMLPTAAALGPWRRDALHGGAVSGLLGHSLAEDGWAMARLTVNLMRRVPLQPLHLVPGPTSRTRRVLRKRVELWAGQDVVATADALLLPDSQLALPPQPNRILPIPDELQETTEQQHREYIVTRVGFPSFVSHAVATHRTRLPDWHPAPFAYWIKLLLPVVAGEPITPLQRITAAADYANGGFATLSFEEWSFRSLDLTVQMSREPQGEWIGVTVDSLAGTTAIGLGDSELYDTEGRIGRSVASILVEPR
jgi:hypothetical protein